LKKFVLHTAGLAIATSAFGITTAMANVSSVVVKNTDTLWKISQSEHVSLPGLEAVNPQVNPNHLIPGTTLQIPETYTVRPKDTLWSIARREGIALQSLVKANSGVNARKLLVGTRLTIPKKSSRTNLTPPVALKSDLYWLSHLIYAEANSEPMQAQIAVGDVVYNRAHSSGQGYPHNIKNVIFQVSNGHYQFTCVANRWIYKTPDSQSIRAAQDVLIHHKNLVPNALVFYNPAKTPSTSWVFKQPTIAKYGHLVFAK
jgi:N-acetylmuramoyl-L-alanine amidase